MPGELKVHFMDEIKEEFRQLVLELLKVPEEEREEVIIRRFDYISPDPEYLDYIFHSDEFITGDTFDVDSYISKVFSYKPIQL